MMRRWKTYIIVVLHHKVVLYCTIVLSTIHQIFSTFRAPAVSGRSYTITYDTVGCGPEAIDSTHVLPHHGSRR